MKINKDNKIILWGHKNHHNTFFYIHYAYEKAFKYLGFDTYWLDNNDNISNFDFSNSLFLTEGQADQNIPFRDDCHYILHNCDYEKYKSLYLKNKCITMQIYTDDVLGRNCDKLSNCVYADYSGNCIYFPWATDLLPYEIENNKPTRSFNKESRIINWVGTIGGGQFGNIDQINAFKAACENNNITFRHASLVSADENVQLIRSSYMAPAIVGTWQKKVGCTTCRIFKNISYGQMGITNSPRIYELFEHKIIFNADTNQLFYDAKNYLENMQLSELHSLMDFVKNNHTYINRINVLLDFINTK